MKYLSNFSFIATAFSARRLSPNSITPTFTTSAQESFVESRRRGPWNKNVKGKFGAFKPSRHAETVVMHKGRDKSTTNPFVSL